MLNTNGLTTKRVLSWALALLLAGLAWSSAPLAGEVEASSMHQMAEIMHRLKHYPSPAGKTVLEEIANNASASKHERTLAMAMLNLEHKAAAQDIPKLKAIVSDAGASADEKTLAGIISNLDHRPTKQNKQQLQAMMDKMMEMHGH
jgi:hypothetical protein